MNTFKSYFVISDTLYFKPNQILEPSYSLLTDSNEIPNFIPGFKEEKFIVEDYFEKGSSIELFMNELFGFHPLDYLREITEPFCNSNFEDEKELDLIIVNPNIKESIEIEFKPIHDEKNNTLENYKKRIKKLVKQANLRYPVGFHKVYAGVIIKVDGFKQKSENHFYRNLSDEDIKIILNMLNHFQLNPNIGILFLEIVCTTYKSMKDQKGVLIGIVRDAIPQEQKSDVSEKIEKLLIEK